MDEVGVEGLNVYYFTIYQLYLFIYFSNLYSFLVYYPTGSLMTGPSELIIRLLFSMTSLEA